jgi:hypothetical protein
MKSANKNRLIFALGVALLLRVRAAEAVSLGANSCSASSCHGGAGDKSSQFVTWSQRDVHSRSYATLATARAARMGEALGIPHPEQSSRCVVCHAPLAGAPPGTGADPAEGVSCDSCHALPDGWLRGHTRPDWTHADRVAAGMRDLNDLYTRANTCVACHQNIDPEIVRSGRHPTLVFELDGQTQDEPRHWREIPPFAGAQAWCVGQSVALREASWSLLNGSAASDRAVLTWQGLAWLANRSGLTSASAPHDAAAPSRNELVETMATADQLARRAARAWTPRDTWTALRRLSATQGDFLDAGIPALQQAYRAERLVLALDRLVGALPPAERGAGVSSQLDRLFELAQSQPDFAPAEFAEAMGSFSRLLGPGESAVAGRQP